MKQLLFFLCCCEVLFATWLINTLGPYVSSLLMFSISIGIAYLYLRISTQPQLDIAAKPSKMPPKVATIIQWALFAVLSYVIFSWLKHFWWHYQKYGDLKGGSDVIPQITTLVQRFLAGEQPYYTIHFNGYDLFPTYLPLQWMPYILMEWAHKDYRWVPTLALWAVSLYIFLNNRNKQAQTIWEIIAPVWPLVVWCVFATHDNRMFVYTVEGLIAAYYLFVAERIDKKGILLLAMGIGACLLSRYSIVFWVPLCVLLFFISGKRKEAIIICVTIVVLFAVFYWLPFLRRDGSIFFSGYAYHTKATYYEWMRDLKVFNGGVYLFNGLGFSCFAMTWLPGDEGYKLMLYKNIHITMCLLTVAGLAWYYIRKRAELPLHTFLLFSFKVYLTVFYTFIQLPYKYLYFVPIIVSASLLGRVFRGNPSSNTDIK